MIQLGFGLRYHPRIDPNQLPIPSCASGLSKSSTKPRAQFNCSSVNVLPICSTAWPDKGTVTDDSSSATNIVLVPAPSKTDPNDPLRWPKWKKHVAFTVVYVTSIPMRSKATDRKSCAFTFLTNYGIGGLAPAFYILHLEFDKTLTETSHLLLYPILVLGLFNFVHVPLANYFGKRPIFVFASLLLCACYIWGACASTFKSLLWSNIIAAMAGSSTEALGAAIVNVSLLVPAKFALTWYPGAPRGSGVAVY